MASPAIELLKHIVHKDLMDDVAKKRLKILPRLGEPESRPEQGPELIWPLAKSMNKEPVGPENELDVTRIIAYEPLVGINRIVLHDKWGGDAKYKPMWGSHWCHRANNVQPGGSWNSYST